MLNRRNFLRSAAAVGAVAGLPGLAHAQLFGNDRNRVLRETDREANTLAALQSIDTYEPILSYDTAYNLQLAIMSYQELVSRGGWPAVPRETYELILGNDRNSVPALKQRLVISGDMAPQDKYDKLFDTQTDIALRRFQARHGLIITGKVDEPTFYALNISADYRLAQLQLNAMRVQNMAATLSDRYVVVNIPAASIEAIEGSSVVQRHTAVVGRIDRQTPILASKVHQINFNPYWHVPKSIIERDIIKYMNQDPEYLTKYNIHIYDGNGREIMPYEVNWQTNEAVGYMLRQEPGGMNSMGHVKINFYNQHDVYLHDTPTKELFGENARFHSSGCVRVENPNLLVAWLLRDSGWDQGRVDVMFNNAERLDVSLDKQVPIHTSYITAWANRAGVVSFRGDVYEFDAVGKTEFEA
jgi:murein L,D-transpeptidase YcbB/YkuD